MIWWSSSIIAIFFILASNFVNYLRCIQYNSIYIYSRRVCRITFVGPRKNSVIPDNRTQCTPRVIIERVPDDRWHVTHACVTLVQFVNKLAAIGSRDNALFTIVSWQCILKEHPAVQGRLNIDICITQILFHIFSRSIIPRAVRK